MSEISGGKSAALSWKQYFKIAGAYFLAIACFCLLGLLIAFLGKTNQSSLFSFSLKVIEFTPLVALFALVRPFVRDVNRSAKVVDVLKLALILALPIFILSQLVGNSAAYLALFGSPLFLDLTFWGNLFAPLGERITLRPFFGVTIENGIVIMTGISLFIFFPLRTMMLMRQKARAEKAAQNLPSKEDEQQ